MTTARRSLMFATVIVACAGSGFLASRLWPLPAFNPGLKVASADPTGPKEADRLRRSIDVRSAARSRDEAPQLAPERGATDATERPVHAALVLLNPHSAEQPREFDEAIERATVEVPTAPEATRPTRAARQAQEKIAPPRQPAARREKPSIAAKPSQPSTPSTSPQRDAALRDFMSHNPPFRP
jgi:hypothetical protein